MIQKLTIITILQLVLSLNALSNIKTPDFYHNSTQAQQLVSNLISSSNNIKRRYCSRGGYSYSIVEINGNGDTAGILNSRKKLEAIITCNVHSRQFFTAEVCLKFIKNLVEAKALHTRNITNLINFRIFYLGNEMRDNAINGQFCKRTDKNDVDVNRNFPTGYQGQKSGQQVNPGPSPISEPLSQCIQQEVNSLKPDIFLDVHTGQFSLYYTSADQQSKQHHDNQRKVLNSIITKICKNCRLRQQGLEGVIYADMKIRKQVKWANLIQIYGGYSAYYQKHNQNNYCFVMFNPYDYDIYRYYRRRSYNIMVQYFRSILEFQFGSQLTKRHLLSSK